MSDTSEQIQTKTCTSCLVTKPVTEYYTLKGGKYGVRAKCIECSRADARLHLKETYVPSTVQAITDEELFVLSRQFLTERIAAGAVPEEAFIKGTPHPKQKLFLDIEHDETLQDQKIIEVLFGGSVGGGKTWTLLAAALKYVHVPGYSALLLRKSFPDLAQEGGLIALSKEWLSGTAARWNETMRTWTFPSGATLRFGYLETESDKFRYLGGEYQFVGWDELTQHYESAYKFLFSRVRKRADIPVPLRVMGATNPGNIGGKWVYERFIPVDFSPASARERDVWYKEHAAVVPGDPPHITAFIPSMLDDNPSLDREAYLQSLMQLDEITRQQYLSGDWQIQVRGDILYTYSEAHTVISWSQFEKVIGQRKIPAHWKIGVYLDAGTTEGHPNITSWFATAANNAPTINGVPLAGKVFLYRGHMTTQTSAREMSGIIADFMREEKSQCINWQMSHEASSERIEFNKQGLPFAAWKTGRTRGIEQLKNAFSLTHTDKPNPFKPELKGSPQLFLIVDDRELVHAQSDKGLARWREEILAYHWNTLKSGEPTTRLVPYPLFNDAVDTMRAAAADYWPVATQKTLHEKVADAVEEVQPKDFIDSITDPSYKAHVLSQRQILAEQARARLKEVDTILADWTQIG